MQFKRLKASIAHNADEAPSIYLAICAMESLVYDIEDEAGCDISECQMGDETLPTKLAWLCGTIEEIYEENRGAMVRNRDRLRQSVTALQSIRAELTELAEAAQQLSNARKRLEEKQAELARAKEDRRAWEAVTAQCAEAEQELQTLKGFDVPAERRRLKELQDQSAALRVQQETLRAQLTQAQTERDGQAGARDALQAELAAAQEQTAALNAQQDRLRRENERQRAENARAEQAVHELETQRQSLTGQAEQRRGQELQLQKEIGDYTAGNLPRCGRASRRCRRSRRAWTGRGRISSPRWMRSASSATRLSTRLPACASRSRGSGRLSAARRRTGTAWSGTGRRGRRRLPSSARSCRSSPISSATSRTASPSWSRSRFRSSAGAWRI